MKTQLDSLLIHTNGRLRSLVLPNGHGGLFYDWIALTRWSDQAPAATGPFLYLREGDAWHVVENGETRNGVTISLDVCVAQEVDVEIRRITVSNVGEAREVELTTYAEISLNHPMGDAGHPAFSKLFVQTEQENGALLARRRPRGANEQWPWVGQVLAGDAEISHQTNRVKFLGRGRSPQDPIAMDTAGALSGETGNVLDPVMAQRAMVSLAAGETKTFWLLTAVGEDRGKVLDILAKADGPALFRERVGNAHYDALASRMLLGRTDRKVPENLVGSGVVHRYPIGPDELRLIVAAGMEEALIAALPYWQSLGLKVRIFVMGHGTREGVTFVDPADFTPEEMIWWMASAQLVVDDAFSENASPRMPEAISPALQVRDEEAVITEELQCFNGHGGFSQCGREYVIPLSLRNGRLNRPPMPWVNVLANPRFGCVVSESGAGNTWARNSQANRLTPWSNDPVIDPHDEPLYLRDEESGEVWSPVPGPCAPRSAFIVRHGFGRTRFISKLDGIAQEVEFLVPPEDPVKLIAVRLKNTGKDTRILTFSCQQKLVMGSTADRHHAVLAWTDAAGVQHAVNPRAGDFAGGRAFSAVAAHGGRVTEVTGGNSAGDLSKPHGFGRDACFFRKVTFELQADAEIEILVMLGEAMTEAEEAGLIANYQAEGAMARTSAQTDAHWVDLLDRLKIQTPLQEVDLMVNGWLLYQNLACRIWGRSAFYQSGGAYGFRDQLQDSGALAALHPELMREQILLHAAQQFPEGDVTHWWHPEPMGRGMRTKFSDDLLWLPWLTQHYLEVTGDRSILGELQPFIEGPGLKPGEDEEYMKPAVSEQAASVFEHCCRAIDRSLTSGAHGLPLMGIGDWNDGMSRIGREGRGESVWMGFFLYEILRTWIPLCAEHGESERATTYSLYREKLLLAINDAGWDGEWYRRAYYDDGTPLGTKTDDECKIDALAQAWAVISKAAPQDRADMALDALERELIDDQAGIIRLLDPPFVNTPHDPGYIKGYVAGVRENGGQYTHAACWVVRAMAEAGRREEATRLLQRLSPIWQARDAAAVSIYQVEPYAIAADIYGSAPHVGRGGWTWYTGSAGWMFRVAVEFVLGLRVENGNTLSLDPRVPEVWPGFSIDFRTPSGRTLYRIKVEISGKTVESVVVDGVALAPDAGVARWPMLDDGGEHTVVITLG